MLKTIKPFGIAAIGLAAVASNRNLTQPYHTCSIDTLPTMKKRTYANSRQRIRKNQRGYIIKETHVS